MDERIERANQRYELSVFGGDSSELSTAEQDLDGVEADLTLARGRIIHARFLAGATPVGAGFEAREEDPRELELFARALHLYQRLGDIRGEGEAHFWIGIVHQVIRNDQDSAVPAFERSLELATQAGDKRTMSYALRHLALAEHAAGRLPEARARLEESVRLRREIGFLPGVAANLIGLAYMADGQDRLALLDEAAEIAEASGANGILRAINEART